MEKHIPVARCKYCGSEDFGIGCQHSEGLVTFKYHGILGNRLKYIICRRCGAVLYQCVTELQRYPSAKLLYTKTSKGFNLACAPKGKESCNKIVD